MTVPDIVAADGDITIRRMRPDHDDLSLIAHWRNEPHVLRWWDPDLPPATVASIAEEYEDDMAPGGTSTPCIIEWRGKPIGFIQFYRWRSYAEEAKVVGIPYDDDTFGLDIFIGEPALVHRGLGTRAIRLLCDHLERTEAATSFCLTTDVMNKAAQRCYEKAGFRKVRTVLDTDTFEGERITSWLMIRGSMSPHGSDPA